MKKKIVIYWARRDLRMRDNPALFAAVAFSKKENIDFLPIFILEEYMTNGLENYQFGYPSRFFLINALPIFAQNFKNFNVFHGKAAKIIKSISDIYDITVFVNEDVYSDFYTQIKKIRDDDISIKLYSDALTISKETKTGSGNIYSVFTPFKNTVWDHFINSDVLAKPNMSELPLFKDKILQQKVINCDNKNLQKIFSNKKSFQIGKKIIDIDNLINVKNDYSDWYFSEEDAVKIFDSFLKNKINKYKIDRDVLSLEGTSKMSLALAWGLVSSRFLTKKILKNKDADSEGSTHFISELIWREFYKYLSFHKPELMNIEFQQKFRGKIEWVDDKTAKHRFEKWIKGETGYPIVDAAMMQLAKTGYMHNRARMIVASVLTKNFGVDWRWGQEYFRAMLIDLDESSNNGGWQWGASVGADQKPIRIFNPYLQAENYDKDKIYQKKYLTEDYFENPPSLLIEHKKAREGALQRYGLSEGRDGYARDY